MRIENCSAYESKRGLRKGMLVTSVQQGKDMVDVRDKSLREVSALIKQQGLPIRMEFETPPPKVIESTQKIVFGLDVPLSGKDKIILMSEDPLDQMWKQLTGDGDGDARLQKRDVRRVLTLMGRRDDGPAVSRVMKELDTDGSGDVDIQEFEAWYRKQEDQKLGGGGLKMPVCIDSPGEYGASRGLAKGLHILKIQDEDVRALTLREINAKIKAAPRPLSMEFEPVFPITIAKTAGAGYGLVLSPNLRVIELKQEKNGMPGPAEEAGVCAGWTLVKIDDDSVRDQMDAATMFSSAKGQPVTCVFKKSRPMTDHTAGTASPARQAAPPLTPPQPRSPPIPAMELPDKELDEVVAVAAAARELPDSALFLVLASGADTTGLGAVMRCTVQVLGCLAEVAAAGSVAAWLQGGSGWRGALALLCLIIQLGAGYSGATSRVQDTLSAAALPVQGLSAERGALEASIWRESRTGIIRSSRIALALSGLLVALLAEPTVKEVLPLRSNGVPIVDAAIKMGDCVASAVTSTNSGGLYERAFAMGSASGACIHTACDSNAAGQLAMLACRLLALTQTAALVGWWVHLAFQSSSTATTHWRCAAARLDAARHGFTAASDSLSGGQAGRAQVNALLDAIGKLAQVATNTLCVLGVGAAGAVGMKISELGEAAKASALDATCWLLLVGAGMTALCFKVGFTASEPDEHMAEWGLRFLVAEAVLLSALSLMWALGRLSDGIRSVDGALSSAAADVARSVEALVEGGIPRTSSNSAVDQRLHALTELLAPRTTGLRAGSRSLMLLVAGVGVAAVAVGALMAVQASDVMAVNIALELYEGLQAAAQRIGVGG